MIWLLIVPMAVLLALVTWVSYQQHLTFREVLNVAEIHRDRLDSIESTLILVCEELKTIPGAVPSPALECFSDSARLILRARLQRLIDSSSDANSRFFQKELDALDAFESQEEAP